MAKPPSRGDATTWLTTPHMRAQRLHNSTRRCIRPMLRGRPPLHRRAGDGQQAFQKHPATRSPTTSRRPHSWLYHQLLGQKHLQQRWWLLWDQSCRLLHNRTPGRSRHEQLQPSTSTRKQHSESNFRDGTRTQQRRTCSLPKDGWQITMDDAHKARHWLCNKGACKSTDAANNSRPTKAEAPTAVHQRNTALQAVRETNNQDSKRQKQHLTFRYSLTVIGQDVQQQGSQRQDSWSKSLEQQSTTAAEHKQQLHWAAQRRNYTVRNQHWSNRSTTHQQLPEEAINMKKINICIHTDSSSGKSMATRIGTSMKAKHIELKHLFIQQLVAHDLVRTIKISTTSNPADQIRCNRDVFASHQWCLGQHPSLLNNKRQHNNSLTAASALMCERVYTVRTTYETRTHTYIQFLHVFAIVSAKVDNKLFFYYMYFNMEYINIVFSLEFQHGGQHGDSTWWFSFEHEFIYLFIVFCRMSAFCWQQESQRFISSRSFFRRQQLEESTAR